MQKIFAYRNRVPSTVFIATIFFSLDEYFRSSELIVSRHSSTNVFRVYDFPKMISM